MKKETITKVGIWFGVIAAIILVVFGGLAWRQGYRAFFGAGNPALGDWGNYGSYLQGTTATLWSLAGLLIIFVAFLAQKQQLKLQQKQFEQQSFENHFFQLLDLHKSIVDDIREKNDERQGRVIFSVMYRKAQIAYEDRVDGPIENDTEELAISSYEAAFDDQPEVLGHYFRNLYHIIKYVHESGTPDKKRYTSIVRAQLSSYEHVMLHYNGISTYGEKKFKYLIEEYALLENMGPGLLMNPKHPTSYLPKAFGEDVALFVFKNAGTKPA